MSYQEILFERTGHDVTIILNRPSRLNAWTGTMEAELRSAVQAADADPSVRAIIVTGAGRGFCAGADMDVLDAASKDTLDLGKTLPQERGGGRSGESALDVNYTKTFSYLLRTKKPIIAAINGPIAGIGLCLVLFCDFRFMADTARLTTAFARRGLIAEHGMSWMLPRLIGPMNALDLMFSARIVEAAEAERLGLVQVLPAEGFLDAVKLKASEQVSLSSPRSIGVMKRQVYDSLLQSLGEAWDVADAEMKKSLQSEDFKEGVAHFLEKRPPAFTGK
ncbi:enoyl-CoA hydratase [Bradyrhizobium sp. INPA01-394B]|uniref:Enoyl-CoA hydratase/isomerase family protein n=1 Tax=Bradyrhizobium campsiandrae TaxID=1729892 RepID=A0ABR7U3F0_9BRAD|nr:enoyl-CoA hydratase-related protein [Bradyrhizobium campsiandrae]MBC9879851.1 enoyl-CoA hydratase [Bradyrhizobium campsiandrae]MBC9978536.1 enoyl-CoA hydratase/isomerase family protein [Bradyrhizobium campsiandrae]